LFQEPASELGPSKNTNKPLKNIQTLEQKIIYIPGKTKTSITLEPTTYIHSRKKEESLD
jgi:hypothetical protein